MSGKLRGTVQDIPIGEILPAPWNPNQMDEEEFNILAEKLDEIGMIDPIQVLPKEGLEEPAKYQIVGGEHRWKAARALGWETLPCVVLDPKEFDEDRQKFVNMQLNIVKGRLNKTKFMALYKEMAQKYSDEALKGLMGFSKMEALQSLVGKIQRGLPGETGKRFGEAAQGVESVKDLGRVIQQTLTKHGSDLQHSFIVLTLNGRPHYWVQMSSSFKDVMDDLADYCRDNNKQMHELLEPAAREWLATLDK